MTEVTDWLRGGADLRSRCQRDLLRAEQDVASAEKVLAEAKDRVRELTAALAVLPEPAALVVPDSAPVDEGPPPLFPPLPMTEGATAADAVRAIIDANPKRRLTSGEIIEIAAKVHPRKLDIHSTLYKLVEAGELDSQGERGHRTYARVKVQEEANSA